jgi:hypothetical protein
MNTRGSNFQKDAQIETHGRKSGGAWKTIPKKGVLGFNV